MPEVRDNKNIDPLRQLIQNMNVMQAPQQPPVVNPMNPMGMVLNHNMNAQAHMVNIAQFPSRKF